MSPRKTPNKPKIPYEYSVEKMMRDLNSHEKEKKQTKIVHKVSPLTKEQIQKRINRYSLEKAKNIKDGKKSKRKRSPRKRSRSRRSRRSRRKRSKKVVKTL
jgi:hypothetical protein